MAQFPARHAVQGEQQSAAEEYEEDPLVDPQVATYVGALVGALGGRSTEDEDKYLPGDDALGCLKDLKRWLRLYDERFNRLDVARFLAFSKTLTTDLLEIIALWRDDGTEDSYKSRLVLACLEILVPLTWPIEKAAEQLTRNHHRHMPALQRAQIQYKKDVLNYEFSGILRQIIRVGLPSMAEPMRKRGNRGEGILKLILYFIRNITMISRQSNDKSELDELEMSRSVVLHAFQYQEVFQLLLTISSMMGEEFDSQDVIIIEILFYLLRGIDVEKVFLDDEQMSARKGRELEGMLGKEAVMRRGPNKAMPTRHGRFGTTVWLQRPQEKMSIVSGQSVLLHPERALEKMDESKKFNKPRKKEPKQDSRTRDEFDSPILLEDAAYKLLRGFVSSFIDSSFNPLFNHFRKAIERESERVEPYNERQFYFLVSWFLQAARRRAKTEANVRADRKRKHEEYTDGFGLVASVLTQEMFIGMTRFLRRSLDEKSWMNVNAAMKCFTQILLTVQEMTASHMTEDQDIAENIQKRLFYEEATHDLIIQVARGYTNQGFGYLDACTELVHVFLGMLEHFSKQNIDMQVKSARRARNKKRKIMIQTAHSGEQSPQASHLEAETAYQDEEPQEITTARAVQLSRERKFDFARFAAKFATQQCIDTFVQFTSFYIDMLPSQLKRAHRFFHRISFKMDMSVLLMRVDILQLLMQLTDGAKAIDHKLESYQEWKELVRQIIRKSVKKIQQRPELGIEMLFSKINSTVLWLEHGTEAIVTRTMKQRAAAEVQELEPAAVSGLDDTTAQLETTLLPTEQFFGEQVELELTSTEDVVSCGDEHFS